GGRHRLSRGELLSPVQEAVKVAASAHRETSPRRIGAFSAAALVAANMIGAGVFTTSGLVLDDLRRPELVLLAWAIAGLFAVCGALSYGALARLFPESGGEYHFLRVTVHPFAGFLAGWVSLVAGFTVPIAIVALTFGAYVGPVLGEATSGEWIGTAAIALAALMHGVALRFGLAIQNVAVAVKLLLIGGFIVLGAVRLPAFEPGEASSPDLPFDLGALAVAVVVISFSYSGWNAAVYIAGEIREPERNLRRALLLGTGVVTIVYLALNAVFLWSAPPARLAGEVDIGAVAALTLGG